MPMKLGYIIINGSVTARHFHGSYSPKEIRVKLLKKIRKETSEDGTSFRQAKAQ